MSVVFDPHLAPPRQFRLLPADIVLVGGASDSVKAEIVNFFQAMETPGPDAWIASHVAWVVEDGCEDTAQIAEALWTVKIHGLMETYGGSGQKLLIVRPINVPMDVRLEIARRIRRSEGKIYGALKLVLQAIDAVISFFAGRDICLSRRLCMTDAPICSTLGTEAFKEAGLDFGIPARAANPFEIQRFALANPDKYAVIYFGVLPKEEL